MYDLSVACGELWDKFIEGSDVQITQHEDDEQDNDVREGQEDPEEPGDGSDNGADDDDFGCERDREHDGNCGQCEIRENCWKAIMEDLVEIAFGKARPITITTTYTWERRGPLE